MIRICVQSTYVYVSARRWDEILDYLIFFSTHFFAEKGKPMIFSNLT